MPMDESAVIARCAQIAEDAARELEELLKLHPQKKPDDIKTAARVQYGIRWCRIIAARIRNVSDE